MNLGNNIKSKRKALKISQAEMAKKIGVNQCMLSFYEKDLKTPSVQVLLRIAKELNCKIDDLI